MLTHGWITSPSHHLLGLLTDSYSALVAASLTPARLTLWRQKEVEEQAT